MADLPAYSPRTAVSHRAPSVHSAAPPSYRTSPVTPRNAGGPSRFRRQGARPSTAPGISSAPSFNIGSKRTPALVAPTDLKAHLTILRHFYRLREEVISRAIKSDSIDQNWRLAPEDAWIWFLTRAKWRFELWLSKVVQNSADNIGRGGRRFVNLNWTPPLDVVIIWHSYFLHPRAYLEDGLRYHPDLYRIGSFPLHEVANALENDDPFLPGSVGQARSYHWESCTGEPWQAATSPHESPATFLHHCPSCSAPIDVPWLTVDGRGWAQANFVITCEHCRLNVTTETFGVARFSDDLRKVVKNPNKYTLATMYYDEASGRPSTSASHFFNRNLALGIKLTDFDPSPGSFAGKELKWSLEEVASRCTIGFRGPDALKSKDWIIKGVQAILGAYFTAGRFSVDLVAAADRHMRFVDQLVELGWTDHAKFDDQNEEVLRPLQRAVAQYHAFLDVMALNPNDFIVPTLGIDLAWHTHQLLCVEYRDSTKALFGTIVDHDDSVEQEYLAASFENTSKLWVSRFGIPYSTCGCPALLPSTRPKALSAVSTFFSKKGKQREASPSKVPNPRPDLLSSVVGDGFENHPSEHPQITVINDASIDALRAARGRTAARRLADDGSSVSSGIADGWQVLLNQQRKIAEGGSHTSAFIQCRHHVDKRHLKAGTCVMGIGAAGMCVGGNKKMKTYISRSDDGHMPARASRNVAGQA